MKKRWVIFAEEKLGQEPTGSWKRYGPFTTRGVWKFLSEIRLDLGFLNRRVRIGDRVSRRRIDQRQWEEENCGV